MTAVTFLHAQAETIFVTSRKLVRIDPDSHQGAGLGGQTKTIIAEPSLIAKASIGLPA
jgi:hypothetical protein